MRSLAELRHFVRWRLTATRRLWSTGMTPDLPMLAPEPLDSEPRGVLDTPGPTAEVERGAMQISGWAVFPSEPTARVEAWLDEQPLGRARVGKARLDLEEFAEGRFMGFSGFEMSVDLNDWEGPDGNAILRVVATGTSGQSLEMEPVPIVVTPKEDADEEALELPPPPPLTPRSEGGSGRRLLVVTHQLTLGGAQLYLLDLILEMMRQDLVAPTVVSGMDGPLRKTLEGLGVDTHVTDLSPTADLSSHIGRVEELADWAADRGFEATLINTATAETIPGAEAAELLGIPVVWAIHESFPPAVLWAGLAPEVRERAEAALGAASAALFEADATREMYGELIDGDRSLTVPYGLDLEPIDAKGEGCDQGAARRGAGIAADAEVVLCVGTVEPRKAQLPLAQAFDLIADRHPRAHLVFVGGREDDESEALAEYIEGAASGRRIELIPVTPDVEAWYRMADLLVCASDIESLPRTVLEAMARRVPVLATSVFGLPELIDDGDTGWLCDPRDTRALADGLDRALSTPPPERVEIADRARALVESRHDLPTYAKRVSDLLDRAVSDHVGAK